MLAEDDDFDLIRPVGWEAALKRQAQRELSYLEEQVCSGGNSCSNLGNLGAVGCGVKIRKVGITQWRC